MSLLRRGFKAQCERRSVEVRKLMGIGPTGALPALHLATHLGVTVWSATDIRELNTSDRNQLLRVAPDEWSAFVIKDHDRFLVVYNPCESASRTNSVVMHELAHIMLGHELPAAEQTVDGHLLNGNFDQAQEAEADWLAGTLLLPRPALLWMRSKGMSDYEAMDYFTVSEDMLRWRVRMTGVDFQITSLAR